MKLLYIAPEYPNAGRNAAQVRANALLPRLSEKADLRVFAYPPHDPLGAAKPDAITTQVDRVRPGMVDLLRATFSEKPRAFLRYDTKVARQRLTELLEEHRPDLVHFDSIGTLALLDLVNAAPCRPRIIAHTHDSVSQLYTNLTRGAPLHRRPLVGWERRKYSRIEREELPKCDTVIVDSPEDAALLASQTGGNRVDLVPLGVDVERFSPEGPRADLFPNTIVFSGSMASEQSADAAGFLVQEIMPKVWERFPEAHVYLVGGNPQARVRGLAGEDVTVTGFVDDLPAFLRAANVYVCPLRLGSGMRTRVVEALACGCRTVATPFAMRGIVLPEQGRPPWIEAEDAGSLAQAVIWMLEESEADMGKKAARHAAAHYSWDAVAAKIAAIYEELLPNE